MTWNYRLCKHKVKIRDKEYTIYDIRDVYYNEDGSIYAYSEEKTPLESTLDYDETEKDAIKTFKFDLTKMLECISKPVLDLDIIIFNQEKGNDQS